ncbi:hypothetical protein FF38_01096 [Lucilia cuprina]|uniref:Uncharacterized protein n=1 Tax=Lucilia cuprina TaxID=7375 RepID=A0A0L0C521_LUCCU|nr:hypothetical protein FF38_01096 [Lucilia cuprina]
MDSMTKRKINLLQNQAFISGIYLDPRFNFNRSPFLTEEHKKSAVECVLKTLAIIKGLTGQLEETEDTLTTNSAPTPKEQFSKLEAKMNLLIQQSPPTEEYQNNGS